jgi:hypothetical protein
VQLAGRHGRRPLRVVPASTQLTGQQYAQDEDDTEEYSSSSYDSSSSDGFPSPSSPKKNQIKQLVDVISSLEKRIVNMESSFKTKK